jgi:hypothetical protein
MYFDVELGKRRGLFHNPNYGVYCVPGEILNALMLLALAGAWTRAPIRADRLRFDCSEPTLPCAGYISRHYNDRIAKASAMAGPLDQR